MCVIEFDPVEVWQDTRHRAKKPHRCNGCGGTIQPGAMYSAVFIVDEGERFFEKSCARCTADRDAFGDAHDGSSPNPSSLRNVLRDCIDDGDAESLDRWQPMLDALVRRSEPEATHA